VFASNTFWGHVGSVASAVLAGFVSYVMYPESKLCFLVIGASALLACFFVQYLPQGDPLMGRGFAGKVTMDEYGRIEPLETDELIVVRTKHTSDETPEAISYMKVCADTKSVILCLTGFFFQ
jgi:hypothetical protein